MLWNLIIFAKLSHNDFNVMLDYWDVLKYNLMGSIKIKISLALGYIWEHIIMLCTS